MTTLDQQLEAALDCGRYTSPSAHLPGYEDLSVARSPFPSRPTGPDAAGAPVSAYFAALCQWWAQVTTAHLDEAERVIHGPAPQTALEYAQDCLERATRARRYADEVSPARARRRH